MGELCPHLSGSDLMAWWLFDPSGSQHWRVSPLPFAPYYRGVTTPRVVLLSQSPWVDCSYARGLVFGLANFRGGPDRVASSAEQAKERMLGGLRQGLKVAQALQLADRSQGWYEKARREDVNFRQEADLARGLNKIKAPEDRVALAGDFAEFRRNYLFTQTWPHQQSWIDILEGRDPSWLHPKFTYEPGRKNRVLINTPPNHSKSTTITMDYATWRICRDPNVRIIIVSKTQGMAKKFLYGIKSRLTHPKYANLQLAFAPPGGFKANADQWTATLVYLGGEERDSGEKDPTVEAIGIGGHIYGGRADLIICDDCVTLSNSGSWKDQMDWLKQEVASRLGPPGKLLVVGTRVATQDLYRELRNNDHYTDGKSPWTYFAQPALLDSSAEDQADWLTLWPESERPFEGAEDDLPLENGNYPRWTGPRLAEVRNDLGPKTWAMVYQQQDVSSDAIFDPVCVRGSVNGMRKNGPLIEGASGHPEGASGFYRICSMDPAMAGDTAAVAYAVDRKTHKRYVLDVAVISAPTPLRLRELIYNWTERFVPHEWIIESNAFQLFLTQDEDIKRFLASKGIPLKGHFTGRQKVDPEFGVASLQPLFGTKVTKGLNQGYKFAGDNLIELPDISTSEGTKSLIEQLVVWDPLVKPKNRKCDAVMALWFAELRAREVVSRSVAGEQWYSTSQFMSVRDTDKRMVIDLDEQFASGGSRMSYL